jgi:hypothetical protein
LGDAVAEGDSKRIIRQWNREIEDDLRRDAARDAQSGAWKAVSWAALWLLWLLALVGFLGHLKGLR